MSLPFYLVIITVVISLPVLAIFLPKPWWKLSQLEKKGRLPFVIIGVILASLGVINLIIVTLLGR